MPHLLSLFVSSLQQLFSMISHSNSIQIPITAGLFFKDNTELWVLKVSASDMGDALKWPFTNELAGCCHLYGQDLGSGNVVDAKRWRRNDDEEWGTILVDPWLV